MGFGQGLLLLRAISPPTFQKHAFNFASAKLLLCSTGLPASEAGPCQTRLCKVFEKMEARVLNKNFTNFSYSLIRSD